MATVGVKGLIGATEGGTTLRGEGVASWPPYGAATAAIIRTKLRELYNYRPKPCTFSPERSGLIVLIVQ